MHLWDTEANMYLWDTELILVCSWCHLTRHIVYAAGMLLGANRQLKAIVYTNMLQQKLNKLFCTPFCSFALSLCILDMYIQGNIRRGQM